MKLDRLDPSLCVVDIPLELSTWVAENAQAIDAGETEVREALTRIAAADLTDLGAPLNQNGQLQNQASVIELLARGSFSAAFALWGHRMVIEFLTLAGGDFAATVLPSLRAGITPGASAVAPGYKALAGAGNLGLRISRDDHGQLRLSGRIAWASNLYSDALVVVPAYGPDAPADATGHDGGIIVAVPLDNSGVTIGPAIELLAMRGTASTYVELDHVPISQDQILSTEFVPFLQRTRPTLSILQASFCLGLASTSYEQAVANATGVNTAFRDEIEQQGHKLAETKQQLFEIAQRVGTTTPPRPVDVLTMRLHAGQVAVELAALELKSSGGQGFITSSEANRRYRESTFIPLQSPSEAQLRWEIEQLSK